MTDGQTMKAKRKTTSSKENWQALRARYTWHLHPPFDKEFDRTHWWKGRSKVEPVASLYELARRHPLVGKGLLKRMPSPAVRATMYASVWGHDPTCPPVVFEGRLNELIREAVAKLHEPPSLYWTCLVGLKSWAKLDYVERKNWQSNVGNLKGLDFRCKELQCRSINQLAHWKIIDERKVKLRKKGQINDSLHEQPDDRWEENRKRNLSVLHNDLAVNPPTAKEWEAAIGYRAAEAYRQGYVLLAVAPGLTGEKLKSVVSKNYHQDLRRYVRTKPKSRSRWEDWLPLIGSFEDAETSQQAFAQEFARYRRVLDGIQFA